jgi:hypothetical protein
MLIYHTICERGKFPNILNLGFTWNIKFTFLHQPSYRWGRLLLCPFDKKLIMPKVWYQREESLLLQRIETCPLISYLVNLLTGLS